MDVTAVCLGFEPNFIVIYAALLCIFISSLSWQLGTDQKYHLHSKLFWCFAWIMFFQYCVFNGVATIIAGYETATQHDKLGGTFCSLCFFHIKKNFCWEIIKKRKEKPDSVPVYRLWVSRFIFFSAALPCKWVTVGLEQCQGCEQINPEFVRRRGEGFTSANFHRSLSLVVTVASVAVSFLSFCGTASETFWLLTTRWQMVQERRQTVLRRAKWKETETKKGMEREKRRAGDGNSRQVGMISLHPREVILWWCSSEVTALTFLVPEHCLDILVFAWVTSSAVLFVFWSNNKQQQHF